MLNRIETYMSERMLFVDELALPVLSSAGSHLVQLHQDENPFYYVSGRNERTTIACVALGPTGCSKTFAQDLLVRILGIPFSAIDMLTSAGLLGSKDQEGRIHDGLAKELSNGVLIVNELSSLVAEKQKEETQLLLNNVLSILSEGKVEKRLGTTHFCFNTNMNLWGSVQLSNKRFDFTGGLARRAHFIFKCWTIQDLKKLVRARRDLRGVMPDPTIRNEIKEFIQGRKIKEIEFDEKLIKWIESVSNTPNHQVKLEKAAIGLAYWYPYDSNETVLKVRLDRTIRKHLTLMTRMWRMICADPEVVLAQSFIRNGRKNEIETDKFYEIFGDLGYTRLNTYNLLSKMSNSGLITYSQDKIKNREIIV